MDAFEVLKQMMLDNGHVDWNESDAEVMARNALDALDTAGFTIMRPITAAEEAANNW